MKIALVNPPWSFHRSIYFGCREAHLPLELGYSKVLLERDGHDVLLIDAQLGFVWRTGAPALTRPTTTGGFDAVSIRAALTTFRPEATVITTAPTYLSWRCAPPELRVPMQTLAEIRSVAGATITVGPHASTTPGATLKKLGVDLVVIGECEDVLPKIARTPRDRWSEVPSTACGPGGGATACSDRSAIDMTALPALRWPATVLARHTHHHHRFDCKPEGPGAEMEASRSYPYHCGFCANDALATRPRRRPLEIVLEELDGLLAAGVRYVCFIDERFPADRELLNALAARDVSFGVQLRIEDWSGPMLELLGKAGCLSIEGALEAVPERSRAGEEHGLSTTERAELFVIARSHVPFVGVHLVEANGDPNRDGAQARARLREHGVSVNDPTPLFPYPGSPAYALRFGACDDGAWERAHAHYLAQFTELGELRDPAPVPLHELERARA
jgi:B12-binding domain/radical SAM domain protein of rhizo-twelve system